jgi:peptidoglycan/xylan/chitin deacetylase (PgdA/CDA1 family)
MIPENLTIINYHKIELDSDIGLTSRHPDDFSNDLDLLNQNGYTTITFKQLKNNSSLPEKPIIITFDDAYLSFYDRALDILKSKRMKAVIYVPVNYIGKKNDWDVQFFKKEYWHMSELQIADASKQGMEIGSHALSHRLLNNMSDKNIKHELKESKEVLENITADEVISVSYPFGRVNKKVLNYTKEYYDFGVQLIHSNTFNGYFNQLYLNRINIYRTDSVKIFLKKLELYKHPLIKIKNQFIQTGAWATVIMQNIRNIEN